MSDDDIIVCYVCSNPEVNPDLVLECIQCCRSAHFACLKISGNAIQKARKKNFYCSPTCSEIFSRNTNKSAGFNDMLSEIRSLSAVIREVKDDTARTNFTLAQTRDEMSAIAKTTRQIEQSQIFLSAKFDEMKTELENFNHELDRLRDENGETRKDVRDIGNRQQYLEEKVVRLEVELDKAQRESLSRNAVILGIPYVENEDVKDLVLKVGATVQLTFTEGDIVGVRRMRVKSGPSVAGPIIVSFRTSQIKENLFDCKRAHGTLLASSINDSFSTSSSRITIRDEITTFGKELLEQAKQMQVQYGYKYVWYGRNGKVLLRRQDGAKVVEISNMQQLHALSRTQKRCLNSSSSSYMSQSSPVSEPLTKKR